MNKKHLKKSGQELQEYLAFRRRGYTVPAKKVREVIKEAIPRRENNKR